MAKKTNDNTIDLLYLNQKPDSPKKKKNDKKQKNKNVPKDTLPKKDIIDIDNEIVIGLTPKPDLKKVKKTKGKSNRKQINKKQKNNQPVKKQVENNKNIQKKSRKNIIRAKILKWTSIAVITTGIVIGFMLSPIFNVKQIDVEGIQKLSKEEIINLSQIQLNENTFKLKMSEIASKIENNTYVESVYINRELPSTIKIEVKERQPQYIIEIANGNAYIDSKGYILEISIEKLQLPLLIGYETEIANIIDFENTKKLSDEDCKKVEAVYSIIESARNNSILEYITSIDISNLSNIKLNIDGEKKVAYFGDGTNANLRILYLKKIIEEEKGKEGEAFINGDLHTLKPKPYFREKI